MKTIYAIGLEKTNRKDAQGIGYWVDDSGVEYVDPIILSNNIYEAVRLGKENRQQCILEIAFGVPVRLVNGFLTYAQTDDEVKELYEAYRNGETSGLTVLFHPLDVEGEAVKAFTIAEAPLSDKVVPVAYRFVDTTDADSRLTYYLNLLLAKTQKAGTVREHEENRPYTVRVGKWAFAPDGTGYEVPAVSPYPTGSFAFFYAGRDWFLFRGLPSVDPIPDELGTTFKTKGRSVEYLLRKVRQYWEKLGGTATVNEEADCGALVQVQVEPDKWLNLFMV